MTQKFTVFLFFFSLVAQTQIKGIVVSEGGKPIPYVNIVVIDQENGTSSEEDGTFTLNVAPEKMLQFSAIGFETKTLKAKQTEKVILKEVVYTLNEVTILRPKFKKTYKLGNARKTWNTHYFGTFPVKYGKVFKIDSLSEKILFLKEIEIYTKSEIDSVKFKLVIYNLDALGFPDHILNDKEIFATTNSGNKKIMVNVQDLNIQLPQNGIFVCFENVLIEQNKNIKLQVSKNKKPYTTTYFEPGVKIIHSNNQNTFRNYKNKWFKEKPYNNPNRPEKFQNKVLEPAINIIVSN